MVLILTSFSWITLQTGTSTAHCGITDRQCAGYAHLVQRRSSHVVVAVVLYSPSNRQ